MKACTIGCVLLWKKEEGVITADIVAWCYKWGFVVMEEGRRGVYY